MPSSYLQESRQRGFCGTCEAGVEHDADECDKHHTS